MSKITSTIRRKLAKSIIKENIKNLDDTQLADILEIISSSDLTNFLIVSKEQAKSLESENAENHISKYHEYY